MTERVPLPLLCVATALRERRAVAVRGLVPIDGATFLARVRAWATAFSTTSSPDHALLLDDAFEFAAALFGGWQAGKSLWLAGDTAPATLERLTVHAQGRACDWVDAAVADQPCDGFGLHVLDPDTCRLVLFTSGSSGEPSAIGKTLRQLDNEVEALEAQFGAELGNAVVHGTVSHQHIYGLLFRVLWPLSAGRSFASQRLAYPEQIAALDTTSHGLIASPAHLKRLPDGLDWAPFARGLRAVFSSGGPLPVDAALDVMRRWNQAPIEVFGSTETGGIAWRRAGTSGCGWRALPGVEWRVQDNALEVRSPHLSDADWVATQDRAVAVDGGFELLGRADRILKLEERRISLTAVERRLQAAPGLADSRVVVLSGQRAVLAAVVVLDRSGRERLDAEGKRATTLRLRAWLADHVDPIALPRRWRFVDALPLDARGKTSERALVDLFRAAMPTPQWLASESNHAAIELSVEAELVVFDGHFPTTPVLPGVALLDWVIRLARQAFAIEGPCLRMDALKFQHIVQPGAVLTLELDWKTDPRVLDFRYRSATSLHASGKLHFDRVAAASGTSA